MAKRTYQDGEKEIIYDSIDGVYHTPNLVEDIVNHPSHYETGKFECFDVMREIYGDDFMKHFCIGNAFKYMYRFPRKNGVEDVRKAKRYLEIFLEIVDEEERNV